MLRLLARAIGEADDGEAGHAVLQVRFHLDPSGVETDERMRDGPRKHRPTLRGKELRVCVGSVPTPALTRNQHVLEELAGAPAGSPVDVTAAPLLERQSV